MQILAKKEISFCIQKILPNCFGAQFSFFHSSLFTISSDLVQNSNFFNAQLWQFLKNILKPTFSTFVLSSIKWAYSDTSNLFFYIFQLSYNVKSEFFFKSQTLFRDLDHIWIFPLKSRHQISWKWDISTFPQSKMIDFWQFQMGKTSILAKFDKLKCQFQWKLHIILAGKLKCRKPVPKKLTF